MTGNESAHGAYRYDVCIVALKCWDYFNKAPNPRYIGGIERDMVTLALLLAKQGLRVAALTYDEGQGDCVTVDGVDVFSTFKHSGGLPGIRFVHPRGTAMVAALRRVRARNIIQMGAGVLTGWTALACRQTSPPMQFIFMAGSDGDCTPELPFLPRARERWLYRFGLPRADVVVTQTVGQAALMRENFGFESEVIRLPSQLPESSDSSDTRNAGEPDPERRLRFLWVGRLDPIKRPQWLFDCALAVPQHDFELAGSSNKDDPFEASMLEEAAKVPNLKLLGRVAPDQMAVLYQRADVLLCTSELEGFPATFLESLANATPIITTFDAGGFVAQYGAGAVVTSQQALEKIVSDPALASKLGDWKARAAQLYASELAPEIGTGKVMRLLNLERAGTT
ncbi:MAG: glycosyltransferase family 4 protein [Pseudomonadota bacterium]